MPTATHGEREPFLASKIDGGDYVRRRCTPNDRRRSTIDHTVPHSARLIVVGVAAANDRCVQAFAEGLNRGVYLSGCHSCLLPLHCCPTWSARNPVGANIQWSALRRISRGNRAMPCLHCVDRRGSIGTMKILRCGQNDIHLPRVIAAWRGQSPL